MQTTNDTPQPQSGKVVLEYSSHAVTLNPETITVGRGPECNFRIVDPVGTHCRLVFISPDGELSSQGGFVRRVIHKGVGGRAGMGIEFGRPD